jgi:hypothetical protein
VRGLRLPEGTSALPGRVRLRPYQVAIADAISDPLVEPEQTQRALSMSIARAIKQPSPREIFARS